MSVVRRETPGVADASGTTGVLAADPAGALVGPGVVLTGRGLVKAYGDTRALDGVDVQVGRTESVAIMGPSGSGKSTLLHVLAGVVRPSAGEVLLDGHRVDRSSEEERSVLRRTRFGFVFQSGQLLPELTARENVALPLMLAGVRRREAVDRASALFEPLGIHGLERRRPGQMSGGQAQRVAIARALVGQPSVVFADEPTGALDRRTSGEVMELLTRTVRERGAALVMVTHDPEVAAACERTIRLRDGVVLTDVSAQGMTSTAATTHGAQAHGARSHGAGALDA
jgi:putative ABC transport system ATP-binding protein